MVAGGMLDTSGWAVGWVRLCLRHAAFAKYGDPSTPLRFAQDDAFQNDGGWLGLEATARVGSWCGARKQIPCGDDNKKGNGKGA